MATLQSCTGGPWQWRRWRRTPCQDTCGSNASTRQKRSGGGLLPEATHYSLLTTYVFTITMSRWAYYQKLSGTLTLFKVDKRTGAPDWGGLRGTAAAEHAVRRRALAGLPFVFAVFCHSDKMFELSVRDEADLNRWLEILPTFVAVDAVAGLGGGSH
eukprot:scaffold129281_cov45-Phaeocystis_antarctica.AAC.1